MKKKQAVILNRQIPMWLWYPLFNDREKGWTDDKQRTAERVLYGLEQCLYFSFLPEQDKRWLTQFNKDDNHMMYGVNSKVLKKLLADIKNDSTMAQPADAPASRAV